MESAGFAKIAFLLYLSFAFGLYLDANVGGERAQPHAHSNHVQREGNFTRFPLRLSAASRGRARPDGAP